MRTPPCTRPSPSTPNLSVDRIFFSFLSLDILALSQLTRQTISIMPCMAYPSGNAFPDPAPYVPKPVQHYHPDGPFIAGHDYPDPVYVTSSEELSNAAYSPQHSARASVEGSQFAEFTNHPGLHYYPPPQQVQADTIHPRLTEEEVDLLFSRPAPVWQQYPESQRSSPPGNVEFEFEYDPNYMPVYDLEMFPETSTVVSVGYECDLCGIDRSTSRRRADPPAALIPPPLLLRTHRSLLDVPAVFVGPRLLLPSRILLAVLESTSEASKPLHPWLPQAAHAAAAFSNPLLILNPRVVASSPRGL